MINFKISFLEKSIGQINQILNKTLPEVVLSGRSNVGKSSLLNAVFSKKIAYTSKSAGKTILINFYNVKKFRFVDVPGYGFSGRAKSEKERFNVLTDKYFKLSRADLVLQLIDFRHSLHDSDIQMILYLSEKKIKFFIIFTKIDKIKSDSYEEKFSYLKSQIDKISRDYMDILGISSKKGRNIKKLKSLIVSFLS
ncbi:MAG: ribosome biogenesis GTP-binding protein YihA/YsxC [Firmicutes bacterium]|nr:ribosome biogenesis GTP-binding protein YihA/YsxC [Bacillota bacterium]